MLPDHQSSIGWLNISNREQVFLEEERKSFIDDYRLTACMNVLKWFVTNLSEQVGNMFIQEHACKMIG